MNQAYSDVRGISIGIRGRIVVVETLPSFAFAGLAYSLAHFKASFPGVRRMSFESET